MDDYPDFMLLKNFADSVNMEFTILHHDGLTQNCNANTIISLFEIETCTQTSLTFKQAIKQIKLEGANSLATYLSKF